MPRGISTYATQISVFGVNSEQNASYWSRYVDGCTFWWRQTTLKPSRGCHMLVCFSLSDGLSFCRLLEVDDSDAGAATFTYTVTVYTEHVQVDDNVNFCADAIDRKFRHSRSISILRPSQGSSCVPQRFESQHPVACYLHRVVIHCVFAFFVTYTPGSQ